MSNLYTLKKEFKLLLFNKHEFIPAIQKATGMSIIQCSELFFDVFRDHEFFKHEDLKNIIDTYDRSFLYNNKINNIITRISDV